jgi:hypothetical protein
VSRGGAFGRGVVIKAPGCGGSFKTATIMLTPGMTLEQQQKQSSSRTVGSVCRLEDGLSMETGALNPFAESFSEASTLPPAKDDSVPAPQQSRGPSISSNTSSAPVKIRKKMTIPRRRRLGLIKLNLGSDCMTARQP